MATSLAISAAVRCIGTKVRFVRAAGGAVIDVAVGRDIPAKGTTPSKPLFSHLQLGGSLRSTHLGRGGNGANLKGHCNERLSKRRRRRHNIGDAESMDSLAFGRASYLPDTVPILLLLTRICFSCLTLFNFFTFRFIVRRTQAMGLGQNTHTSRPAFVAGGTDSGTALIVQVLS